MFLSAGFSCVSRLHETSSTYIHRCHFEIPFVESSNVLLTDLLYVSFVSTYVSHSVLRLLLSHLPPVTSDPVSPLAMSLPHTSNLIYLSPADAAWLSLMHQMAAQDYLSRLQSGAAAAGLHSLAGLPQYEALTGQFTGHSLAGLPQYEALTGQFTGHSLAGLPQYEALTGQFTGHSLAGLPQYEALTGQFTGHSLAGLPQYEALTGQFTGHSLAGLPQYEALTGQFT